MGRGGADVRRSFLLNFYKKSKIIIANNFTNSTKIAKCITPPIARFWAKFTYIPRFTRIFRRFLAKITCFYAFCPKNYAFLCVLAQKLVNFMHFGPKIGKNRAKTAKISLFWA